MAKDGIIKAQHRLVNMGHEALAQHICFLSRGEYELAVLKEMPEEGLKNIYLRLPEESEPWSSSEIERQIDDSFLGSKHIGPEDEP